MDFSSIEDGEACARRAQELWEKISTLNTKVESEQGGCFQVLSLGVLTARRTRGHSREGPAGYVVFL